MGVVTSREVSALFRGWKHNPIFTRSSSLPPAMHPPRGRCCLTLARGTLSGDLLARAPSLRVALGPARNGQASPSVSVKKVP